MNFFLEYKRYDDLLNFYKKTNQKLLNIGGSVSEITNMYNQIFNNGESIESNIDLVNQIINDPKYINQINSDISSIDKSTNFIPISKKKITQISNNKDSDQSSGTSDSINKGPKFKFESNLIKDPSTDIKKPALSKDDNKINDIFMIPKKKNKIDIQEDDSSTSVVSFGEDPLKITTTVDDKQTIDDRQTLNIKYTNIVNNYQNSLDILASELLEKELIIEKLNKEITELSSLLLK